MTCVNCGNVDNLLSLNDRLTTELFCEGGGKLISILKAIENILTISLSLEHEFLSLNSSNENDNNGLCSLCLPFLRRCFENKHGFLQRQNSNCIVQKVLARKSIGKSQQQSVSGTDDLHLESAVNRSDSRSTCSELQRRDSVSDNYPTGDKVTVSNAGDNKSKFQCSTCSKTFQFEAQLLSHQPTEHGVASSAGQYNCSLCNFSINHSKINSLTRHMFTHTKEVPYKCPKLGCDYESNRKYSLTLHVRRRHSLKKRIGTTKAKLTTTATASSIPSDRSLRVKLRCTQCHLVFVNSERLKCHEREHHQTLIATDNDNNQGDNPTLKEDSPRINKKYGYKLLKSSKCFPCNYEQCQRVFEFEGLRLTHVEVDHVQKMRADLDPFFICGLCKGSIRTTRGSMREHFFHHTKEERYGCLESNCTFSTWSRHSMQTHGMRCCSKKVFKTKKYTCVACNESFPNQTLYYKHKKNHPGILQCTFEDCPAAFFSSSGLQDHCRKVHKLNKTEDHGANYICSQCPKSFRMRALLLSHKEIDHRIPVSGQPFSSSETELSHTCSMCGFVADSVHRHRLHMFEHTGESLIKCEVNGCFFSTWERWYLLLHMRKGLHRGKTLKPKTKRSRVECNICHKIVCDNQDLKEHMLKHMGEKPYKCTSCEYSTFRREYLKSHMRNIHKCDIPVKTKPSRNYSDIERIQSTAIFPCDQCFKKFDYKALLLSHEVISHSSDSHCSPASTNRFACNLCDHASKFQYALKNHYFQHTGENRFRCTFSDCTFVHYNLDKMTDHTRTHKAKLPKQTTICHVCGKALLKSTLARHIRTVHKTSVSKLTIEDEASGVQGTSSGTTDQNQQVPIISIMDDLPSTSDEILICSPDVVSTVVQEEDIICEIITFP